MTDAKKEADEASVSGSESSSSSSTSLSSSASSGGIVDNHNDDVRRKRKMAFLLARSSQTPHRALRLRLLVLLLDSLSL